ncbi:MAG: type II toxin-antitoxin system VapC family toxin [Actinomycetales bacterium]
MTQLVDSSVWVDFLRGAESAATAFLADRLGILDAALAVTEPIVMELLAGSSSSALPSLERLLVSQVLIPVDPAADYWSAAAIYRAARMTGRTIRSMNDCLIAAVALRADVTLVHADADFDVIADITALRHLRVA